MRYFYVDAGFFDALLEVSRWSRHRGPRLATRGGNRAWEVWLGCIYFSISRKFLIGGR